jgi:predicted nucleotidyltransferase
MKATDFVRATTAYHDELCPNAWVGNDLQGDVRERLLGIAQMFIAFLEVEGFVVEDIVLTGSMANYNWTQFSDFDLHVVTDYARLQCDDLAEAFYRAKKTIWNNQHDITIYGHEVELYVEDRNEPPVSGGVFSVLHDEWLKTPDHKNPNINDTAVVRKVHELVDQITRAMASADDPEDLKRLTDKLRRLRQAGLDAGGEFSVENLAFKTLRNMGIIKALHDAYINKQDSMMRLNEFAPTQGGGAGDDYLRVLASAWYNDVFTTGSLQKGIKSQHDVERVLARGVICNDGKKRKYGIDYNASFDGVVLSTEDYYEHADVDGVTDTRTGKPFGPYDHIEFSDEQL